MACGIEVVVEQIRSPLPDPYLYIKVKMIRIEYLLCLNSCDVNSTFGNPIALIYKAVAVLNLSINWYGNT